MSTKNYAARVSLGGELKASFKQAFSGASGAVNKLKGEIQGLSRQRRDIEAFQKASKNVDKFKYSLGEAKTKLAEARRALADAEKPTSKLTRAVDTAERKVNGLEASIKRESDALTTLSQKLTLAGIKTADLAKHDAKLERQIEKRGRVIARQRKAEERFSAARSNLGSSAARFGIFTAASAAAFAPMIKAAAEFETRMEGIKKTAGFSDGAGAGLKAAIERLSPETNRSEGDLLGSAEQMAAAGAGLDQIKGSLREIARSSVATNSTMEDLTKTSLAFQDNMKIAASDSKAAFGIIATGAKAGNFEIQDMARALPSVLAKASSIGMGGKEGLASAVAALEVARRGAGTNAEAQTNVENLLAKLTAPGTVKKMSDNFGVDWEKEFNVAKKKGLDPLIFSLDRIQQLTKGDSFKLGGLFEDMQVKAALVPLLAFRKEFDKIRAESLAGEDLIDIDFAKSIKTWPELLTSVKNSLSQMMRMAGDELLPVVKDLAVSVAVVMKNVIAWRKENPKLFSNLVKGAATLAVVTAGLLGMGVAVKSAIFAWSGLSFAISTLGTIISAISLPVVAVVAVLTAAAMTVRKYWEPIKAFFQGVWKGITDGWNAAGGEALWTRISGVFGKAKNAVMGFLEPIQLSPAEFKKFFDSGEKVGRFIGETLVGFINGSIDFIKLFITTIKEMGTGIADFFGGLMNKMKPFFDFIGGHISTLIGQIEKLKNWADSTSGNTKKPGIANPAVMPSGGGNFLPGPSFQIPPPKDKKTSQINHFQIHAAPGQSDEGIAQAVARVLRRERDQASRSSLYDGGEFA